MMHFEALGSSMGAWSCNLPGLEAVRKVSSLTDCVTSPCCAALVGYVEYPIVGLASGFAPISDLSSNATNPVPMNLCVVPGSSASAADYAGELVPLLCLPLHQTSKSQDMLLTLPDRGGSSTKHHADQNVMASTASTHCMARWCACCAVRCHQWRCGKGHLAAAMLLSGVPDCHVSHCRYTCLLVSHEFLGAVTICWLACSRNGKGSHCGPCLPAAPLPFFFHIRMALVDWHAVRAGWLLFMVFAGVGMVALPLDLFRDFMGRPRATITHSEYIKRARGLGVRAKGIKVPPDCVHTGTGSQ